MWLISQSGAASIRSPAKQNEGGELVTNVLPIRTICQSAAVSYRSPAKQNEGGELVAKALPIRTICQSAGIGRQARFRIVCRLRRGGSSPLSGTRQHLTTASVYLYISIHSAYVNSSFSNRLTIGE